MRINHWSFSRLLEWERCPYSITFPYKQTTDLAAVRGREVHDKIYNFLTGNYPDTNNDISLGFILEDTAFRSLRSEAPIAEQRWGFNRTWEPCDYKTSWLRIIPDAIVVTPELIRVIDFKTGKRQYNEIKHTQQLQLYLCGANRHYPDRLYQGEDWYIDEGTIHKTKLYTPAQLRLLQQRWPNRGMAMTSATEFPPKPSRSNCRFCVHKADCQYAFEE